MTSAVLLTSFLLVAAVPQAQAPPSQPQVYRAGQAGVMLPMVEKEVKPSYTREAMANGVQGVVRFECVVNADGSVGDTRVLQSLDPALDVEAEKALKAWRFKPGTKDGVAVPVSVEVEMSFALSDGGQRLESPDVYIPGQQGVTLPKVLSETKPSYTAEAREAGIQGTVTIEAVVRTSGRVGDARVTKPLGSGLDAEAIKTIRQWRFEPGTKDGKAVPTKITLEMNFALK
jgi:TonB family protein